MRRDEGIAPYQLAARKGGNPQADRNRVPLTLQVCGGFGRIWCIVKSIIEVERKAICGVRCLMACCAVGAAIVAIAGDGKAIPSPERAATASPATNAVAATNTFLSGIVVTNAADAALVKEIESGITTLAEDIAEERKWGYDRISDAICKLSWSDLRLASLCKVRVFNAALATRFERIGERVAQEYSDERKRRGETIRRTFLAYGRLQLIASNTAGDLAVSPELPVEDRWRAAFAYYERMKEEYVRMKQVHEGYGTSIMDMLNGWARVMEGAYEELMSCAKKDYPPEEESWFKRRFEEVVGRPPKVRTWEEMPHSRAFSGDAVMELVPSLPAESRKEVSEAEERSEAMSESTSAAE